MALSNVRPRLTVLYELLAACSQSTSNNHLGRQLPATVLSPQPYFEPLLLFKPFSSLQHF